MSCTACVLHETCMSIQLAPVGPAKCDVLIVTDFPGPEEDFQGVGFVGPTSALLFDMINDAGLSGHTIGYTYALRCKPPYGTKPLPAYIDACREHLKGEINARQPRAIVAMGDAALRACTKLSGIKDKRGKKLELHAVFPIYNVRPTVYATYSPAFVRRAPYARNTVVSDLRRIADFLADRSGEAANVPWSIWKGEAITGDVLAYDIEAVDEAGEYTDYPTQIAITGENGTFVSRDVRGLASLLVGRRTVGHNSWGYDVDVLNKFGIPVVKDHDTMVLAYYMDENQPLGLEALAVKYLGVPGWKESFSAKLGSDEFYFYNARDTHYTLALFSLFSSVIGERNKLVDELILPVRGALDAMSRRGVYIDREAVLEQKALSEETIRASEAEISRLVKLTSKEFEEKEFNPGSSSQVGRYLTERGFDLPLTETGKPKTSEVVLQSLTGDIFVAELQKYREAKKTLSTYVLPYLKITEEGDGRAHATFQVVRTKTGRTSSQNPNTQNLTRELKHFFGAPEGKILLSVDYSAIEFRVAAWFAREKNILARFAEDPGWDPHRWFAAVFYGKDEADVTKAERQIAKSANFASLYLGNEVTIHDYAKRLGIAIPLQVCWEIHKAWHIAFPGFYTFYSRTREEILETGQVVCPTGHIRHFGDPKLLDRMTFSSALREGVNVKVQNLSAHIAFLAMRRLHELEMPMVNFVHDSISFEFGKDDYSDELANKISDIMCAYPVQALREEFGVELDIPLLTEAEIKVGK